MFGICLESPFGPEHLVALSFGLVHQHRSTFSASYRQSKVTFSWSWRCNIIGRQGEWNVGGQCANLTKHCSFIPPDMLWRVQKMRSMMNLRKEGKWITVPLYRQSPRTLTTAIIGIDSFFPVAGTPWRSQSTVWSWVKWHTITNTSICCLRSMWFVWISLTYQ